MQRVATILCTTTRIQDVVGRFGGEEFILILKDQNLQQAIEIAERCRKIIEQEEFELETGKILKPVPVLASHFLRPIPRKNRPFVWRTGLYIWLNKRDAIR